MWPGGSLERGRQAGKPERCPLNMTHRKAILCDEYRPPGDRYRVRGTAKPRGGHACGSRGHGLRAGSSWTRPRRPAGRCPGQRSRRCPRPEEPPVPGPRAAQPHLLPRALGRHRHSETEESVLSYLQAVSASVWNCGGWEHETILSIYGREGTFGPWISLAIHLCLTEAKHCRFVCAEREDYSCT